MKFPWQWYIFFPRRQVLLGTIFASGSLLSLLYVVCRREITPLPSFFMPVLWAETGLAVVASSVGYQRYTLLCRLLANSLPGIKKLRRSQKNLPELISKTSVSIIPFIPLTIFRNRISGNIESCRETYILQAVASVKCSVADE